MNYMPKDFTIELRRGSVWETVKTYSNVTGWKNNEAKSFEIADDYPLSAEAFRIKVTSVQGGAYVAIGSIEFYSPIKQ